MKLVIDYKIPFIRGFAEQLGETVYLPGGEISADDVRDADVLIVRTRTKCNRDLLSGSKVSFIATATIGYDHLDVDYLRKAGIAWTNCPGCNARSVAQYVESALLLLVLHGCWDDTRSFTPVTTPLLNVLCAAKGICSKDNAEAIDAFTMQCRAAFRHLTLGVVGVGHVGTEVVHMAQRLGFGRILLCDPPRVERENASSFADNAQIGQEKGLSFVSLEEIASESDVVTFHTPLTRHPEPHATYHMADEAFFNALKPSSVVINSSRGEVVSTEAIKQALKSGKLRAAIIDTWEHEPRIDLDLLNLVFLGTPHIAGYSADGKANGTRMSLQAVARHFGIDQETFAKVAPPALPSAFSYYAEGDGSEFAPELRLYDPTRDYVLLKAAPEAFERLRGNYPLRRERE